MTASEKNLRTCENGHEFEKSSDCLTCPICGQERKPEQGFLSELSAPARQALEHEGITTVPQLSEYSEVEILELHGMGPGSLPILKTALKSNDLAFKNE